MGLRPVRMAALALASVAALATVSGCAGDSPAATDPDPTVVATSETRPSPPGAADRPPPCDAKCQTKREKRRVENEERCASLVDSVDLTWRITATPTDRGQQIGLRMLVVNRSDARLSGDTSGAMRVEPGR